MLKSFRALSGIALVVLLGSSDHVWAQSPVVGVVVGANSSVMAGPTVTNESHRLGVAGGAMLGLALSDSIGVESGVIFSQKGASFTEGKDNGKVRINYLDVPVLLKAGSGTDGGRTGVYALVGPVLSFKLGSSATFNGKTDSSWRDADVRGTDISGLVGVGVSVNVVSVSARYTFGLRTIDATKDPNDFKNRTFSFMVGVRLK